MWERLARRSGGTVAGLEWATGPGGAVEVFAATPTGVFRSTDIGRGWSAVGARAAVPFATAVAAAPTYAADGTLFAAARDGLYRARRAEPEWRRVLGGGPIFALAPATDGTQFVATAADGILRSDDGGATWSSANPGLLDLTVLALVLAPGFPAERVGFAGTAGGLYRTRNGGRSWRQVGLRQAESAVQALAISPRFADDRLVFAGTEADGLFRSADGGTTWEQIEAVGEAGVAAIALARRGEALLVAVATETDVRVSDDGGACWRVTEPLPAPALALTLVPDEAGPRLLAGLAGRGVARLADDGVTWQAANDGLHADVLTVLLPSPSFADDRTIFAASSEGVVSRSPDGGRSWIDWDVQPDEPALVGLVVSPRYAADRTVWAATPGGLWRSADGGLCWERLAGVGLPGALRALALASGSTEGWPLLLAAAADGAVLASENGGCAWRPLGRLEAGLELLALAPAPDYGRDGIVYAVATHPDPSGQLGVLSLWRSGDGGARWERWLEAPGAITLALALPDRQPHDDFLVAGLGPRVVSPLPNAREQRGGVSRPLWRSVALPAEVAAVTSLATPSGANSGRVIFAGANTGVFVSRDGARTFSAWSDGLDPSAVLALATSPVFDADHLIFAAGLDGSVWLRRDSPN